MQININNLMINDRFTYDQDISFDSTTYHNKEIKELKNVHVKGYVYYNSAEILEMNFTLTGNMEIFDSITLEPIMYPFSIKIEEEYSLNDPYFQEYYEKEQNILDIMAILWENIVLEVPICLTKNANKTMHGEGWQLGEEELKEEIDPRLARLAEILDERKE